LILRIYLKQTRKSALFAISSVCLYLCIYDSRKLIDPDTVLLLYVKALVKHAEMSVS